jgi:hypothetical protein
MAESLRGNYAGAALNSSADYNTRFPAVRAVEIAAFRLFCPRKTTCGKTGPRHRGCFAAARQPVAMFCKKSNTMTGNLCIFAAMRTSCLTLPVRWIYK